MFNVSALLLDDAPKPATPLTTGAKGALKLQDSTLAFQIYH